MENLIRKKLGITLLVGTNSVNFSWIRTEILETYKLENHALPTYHYMTKHWPNLDCGVVTINPLYSILTREYLLRKAKRTDVSETKKNKKYVQYFAKLKLTLAKGLLHIFKKCERKLGDIF